MLGKLQKGNQRWCSNVPLSFAVTDQNIQRLIQELQIALEETTIFTVPPHYERWEDGFKSLDEARRKLSALKVRLEHGEGGPAWIYGDLSRIHGRLNDFVRLRDNFYEQFPNGGDSHDWHSRDTAARNLSELQQDVANLKHDIRSHLASKPKGHVTPDLISTALILLLSAAITIFFFWISSQFLGIDHFQKLPRFITGAFSGVWSAVVSGTAGIGLAIIRTVTYRNRPQPRLSEANFGDHGNLFYSDTRVDPSSFRREWPEWRASHRLRKPCIAQPDTDTDTDTDTEHRHRHRHNSNSSQQ